MKRLPPLRRLAVIALGWLDERYFWWYQGAMSWLDAPPEKWLPRGDPPRPAACCITCRQRLPHPP